jgi:predicted nucleic acid binding AN1-type Zn finger protein
MSAKEETKPLQLKKKKGPRCQIDSCKKKLSLVIQTLSCRCEKTFCSQHRLPENHNCGFDFREHNNNKKNIKIEELKCVADKIIRI